MLGRDKFVSLSTIRENNNVTRGSIFSLSPFFLTSLKINLRLISLESGLFFFIRAAHTDNLPGGCLEDCIAIHYASIVGDAC